MYNFNYSWLPNTLLTVRHNFSIESLYNAMTNRFSAVTVFLGHVLFFSILGASPVNICLGEGVLKTTWRRLLSSSSEEIFKTSSRCLGLGECIHLQSFTGYYRQSLVFMWNGALQERFNFCFSGDFYSCWQNFGFGVGGLGARQSFYEVLRSSWYFLIS